MFREDFQQAGQVQVEALFVAQGAVSSRALGFYSRA
jgi:hypothetical protein